MQLLYVNPTGANPVGTVYTDERKAEIYRLAQRYDFLILEDDAYCFLHFLEQQPRSFLSLDDEGRVLRLDSFSKFMSAGLRLGVVTAPRQLVRLLELHVASTTLHASSLSQVTKEDRGVGRKVFGGVGRRGSGLREKWVIFVPMEFDDTGEMMCCSARFQTIN